MKKLMIAVAAAAMIGGAFADTAYTFSASLKTTKGKNGKDSYVTVNLGMDGIKGGNTKTFWYQDQEALDMMVRYPAYWTTKKVGGSTIPALTAVAKKDYAFIEELVLGLTKAYQDKSANRWCETVKYQIPADCYRVAGTQKITDVVVGDFCCTGLASWNTDLAIDETAVLAAVQLFGAQTYDKATKCEIFAQVSGLDFVDAYIAGQGSTGKILDNDLAGTLSETYGVKSISGNMVGVLAAPKCEYCCTAPDDSGAFECANATFNKVLDTAAFGTFKITYSAKETKNL